jgi:hypothetical protein
MVNEIIDEGWGMQLSCSIPMYACAVTPVYFKQHIVFPTHCSVTTVSWKPVGRKQARDKQLYNSHC